MRKGQAIAVIDLEGGQVVDFFAEAAGDPREFLSPGVTIDCNESLRLRVGDAIYTNLYRPMLRVVADDVGEHDLLHPCCRPEMYDFFYQNGDGHPNCLDNINAALGEQRPIITPINLFMHTVIREDGGISVEAPLSKAGDRIVLEALMDIALGVAACSVSESRCNGGKCTAVKVVVETPDRIGRIKEMEDRMNRVAAWLAGQCAEDVAEDVRALDAYYRGPLWRADFEADEAGELPADLLRGVLSEDGLYRVLTEYEERMKCALGSEAP